MKSSIQKIIIQVLILGMICSPGLKAQIVLNELMVRPAGAVTTPPNGLIYVGSLEYIELYNAGCTPVDVSGYFVAMRQELGTTSGGTFRIPNVPQAVIPPKGHLVLASASPGTGLLISDIDIPMTLANSCLYNATFVLANIDGWCGLYNADGTPIDGIYWSASASNITTAPADFGGTICIPPTAPPTVTSLPNAQAMNTLGLMQYVGASFTSGGVPVSRSPDGGAWVRNLASSVSNSAATGNCNNGSCFVAPPSVTGFSYTSPVCATGQANPILVSGFTTGGSFSAPTGVTINPTSGVIDLASSTPGTYTITYTITGTVCRQPGTNNTSITINPAGTPVTSFSYTTPVCANGTNPVPTTAAGFTTGGTFTAPAGVSINATTGVINLAASTPGTYTITYSVPASGCQAAGSGNTSITISSAITPVTTFSYTTPVCANGTNPVPATAAGFTTGGTFTAPAGVSINATTGVINLAATTPGTYTITYSVPASGCQLAGSSNTSITINPTTTPVTGFSYTSPVCANGTNPTPVLASGFTTGGTFTAPAGVSINATTGVINLAATTPGTYTITYSVPASGCQLAGSSNTSITINPTTTPVTSFSYTTPVCASGTNPVPTTAAGFTTGGTFTAPAGVSINATTGVINLAATTPGTYTITYSVAASGCRIAGSSNAAITIASTITPVTSFSYTSPVCANGTNPVPTTAAGFTTGGTFTAPAGVSINATTGVINLAATTPGTYTITYSVPASGCQLAGSSNTSITINPTTTPVTSFSYTSPVCANGTNPTPVLASGFTTGGTFTAPAGVSINATTGVINLAATTPGTYTMTYSVPASGCQLAGSSNTSITINPTTTPVTSFSYTTPVCANGTNPIPATAAGFTTGGTFTAPAGVSINATTGVINLAATTPGTYTITYSVAASGCQLAGSSNTSITINPTTTPVTSFSYATPVCANGTNPTPVLASGFTTGGTFTAPAGVSINATTGVINLAASTPGTYTITYSVPASGCQLAGSSNTSITINPTTTPVTSFSYATPVCANGTNPTPVLASGFTTGGTFTAPAGVSINATTGVINLAATTPGTYTITYSVPASGCRLAGSSNTSITINPTTTPVTSFSYTSPVCTNGTNPVPTTAAGFTTGGTFTAPAGVSINATTGVINLAATTPGTYTITYSVPASGCQLAGSSNTSITINPTTLPTTTFAYSTPVCANGTNPVPTNAAGFTTGGTYTSTAGLAINPTTGIINLSASTPGTYTITYSVAASGCQLAGSSNTSITITPTSNPITTFAYTGTICANSPNVTPTPAAGFTTGGSFSAPAGLSINTISGVINPVASTPGTYTITYSVPASGCRLAGSSNTSITINPTTLPTTTFSYSTPVCANGTNPVPLPGTGFTTGGTYSATPTGLSISPSTGIVNLAASTPGNYTVTYSIAATGCRPAASSSTPLVIRAIPAAPTVVSPVRYCVNDASTALTANGTNLLWYTVPTGGAGDPVAPTPLTTTAGTTIYYVSQTNGGCEGPRRPLSVIVNPLPIVSAGPDQQILAGQSITLQGSTSGNNVTVLWSPNQQLSSTTIRTPVASPRASITYTLTATSSDGCRASDEVNIVVLRELIIPNVFSPNGDGTNDRWIIKYIEDYPNAQVEIFNRYGQKLFERRGYSSANAWDGTYQGKPVPIGAYYYVLRPGEGRQVMSGSVSVIR